MEDERSAVGDGATGSAERLSRRTVIVAAAAVAASLLFACTGPPGRERSSQAGTGPRPDSEELRRGRLRARPRPPDAGEAPVGLHPLGLERGRDGLVFVPSRYQPGEPSPLVVMLHGAGGNAMGGLGPFFSRADEAGVILLSPDSRGRTWDVLLGGYGPDVAFIDRALQHTFGRYAVAQDQVAVEGFSDGASYALGLGLANGDLFRRVIAFSPGFAPASPMEGRAAVFVSHGTGDRVLPIDRCSRRIVPALRGRGYDVLYREFEGGHDIPAAISNEAFGWFRSG